MYSILFLLVLASILKNIEKAKDTQSTGTEELCFEEPEELFLEQEECKKLRRELTYHMGRESLENWYQHTLKVLPEALESERLQYIKEKYYRDNRLPTPTR